MNKSRVFAAIIVASTILQSFCSCGTDNKTAVSTTKEQVQTTDKIVNEQVQTTDTKLEIVVGEEKIEHNTSKTTETEITTVLKSETTDKTYEKSEDITTETETSESMQTAETNVSEPVQDTSDTDLSAEEAKEYIVRTLECIKNTDYEGIMRWSNCGDIVRLADKTNSRPMTDEEIIVQFKNGKYDMSEYEESMRAYEQTEELKSSDLGEPVRMNEDELKELNDFIQGDMFKDSNYKPTYIDGWKIPSVADEAQQAELEQEIGDFDSLAYMYVLKNSAGEWRYDIALHNIEVIFNAIISESVKNAE